MTHSKSWLILILAVLAVGTLWTAHDFRPTTATGAPLAQATATPTSTPTATPTATPTLPAVRVYSAEWGVQSLPAAGVNCVVDLRGTTSPVSCVAGTPVP